MIGGSGNVLAHNFGPEINAHTAVIRFNDAPVTTYEAWVGNKTSLRIQNLDFCGYSPGCAPALRVPLSLNAQRPIADAERPAHGWVVQKGRAMLRIHVRGPALHVATVVRRNASRDTSRPSGPTRGVLC